MVEPINLDKLLPEPTEVTISGKLVKVLPGKMKALIAVQKSFSAFNDSKPEDRPMLIERVLEALTKVMPALADDDIDIHPDQISGLVEIAYKSFMPKAQVATVKAGMGVDDLKKVPKTSQEVSPTS